MKKLFILLILIGFGIPAISLEYDDESKLSPAIQMQKSFEEQDRICKAVASNFRMDPKFAAYVRNSCSLYTIDRERSITNLFPTEKRQFEDGDSRVETAKFAIAKDNAQIQYYRQLADNYCQYKEYKIAQKDSQACERVETIFNSYNSENIDIDED